MEPSTSVNRLLDRQGQPLAYDPRYERWRWQIFAVTWLAYSGFYLTRKSFAVAKIGMEHDASVHLGTDDMARVDGAYLIAYAVGQFLCGVAGDRVGPRRVVLAGLLGSSASAAAMGASSLTVALGAFFCLQGLCQATGWAPLTKNMGSFFSRGERGTVFGLWSTHYAVGGLAASAYAGWWGDQLGWRYAFFAPAATLAVVALMFWLFQRDRPEDVGLPPVEVYHGEMTPAREATAGRAEEWWRDVWETLRNRNILVLCLVYFLLKPTRYAILFWGPVYVNSKLGSGMAESGLLSGLFELAGIFSAVAAGLVSDRVFQSRRMPVCVLCLLALGAFLFFFDDLPINSWALGAGFLLIGLLMFAPDSLVSGVAAVDFASKRGASTAAGLINGAGSVGAILGGTIPGFFSAHWGWSGVFSFLAGMVVLAGLILLPWWNALPAQRGDPA